MEEYRPNTPEFEAALEKQNEMYSVIKVHVGLDGNVLFAFGPAFELLVKSGADVEGMISAAIKQAIKALVPVN
jgi:hypothetical protein